MKKLLAILLAWFTAFYNNVTYVEAPNYEGYQPGEYYHCETGSGPPDNRAINSAYNTLNTKDVCIQTNYTATKIDMNAKYLQVMDSAAIEYSYWWQVNTTSNPCTLETINFDSSSQELQSGAIIVAPSACRRTTPTTVLQNYPISMTLEMTRKGVTYTVTISGLRCWACDALRELDEVQGVPVIIHSFEEDYHDYSMGDVLGIASDGCKIQIYKNNGNSVVPATLNEFYSR